ncbi:hypothetical protein LSPH24S_09470 [Lysinibacillus sphaericus]
MIWKKILLDMANYRQKGVRKWTLSAVYAEIFAMHLQI